MRLSLQGLWMVLTRAPAPIRAFPYWLLVRLPLSALLGLLLARALLEVHAGRGSALDALVGAVKVSLFVWTMLVAAIQLLAIPVGLWVLMGTERWTSPMHWMAVLCAVAYLIFWSYLQIGIVLS